ncbi:MAG: hypothetical protein EA380_10375, partial [Phycisphaeraceae bacterium]
AEGVFRAEWVYPDPRPGAKARFGVDADADGVVTLALVAPIDDDPADFVVRETRTGASRPLSEQLINTHSSGRYTTPRMRNIDRDRITNFDPPMTIMPAQLSPDAPYEERFRVTITSLKAPDRIEQRGSGTSTIAYRGIQHITTPAGEFEAHLIRSEFTTDFGMASARRITDRWYAEGVGLVAESFEERIVVLGINAETRQRSMRRLDVSNDD